VLDGEIVVLDAEGKPDFHKLSFRGQMHKTSEVQRAALADPVTYVVFDLLGAAASICAARHCSRARRCCSEILPTIGPLRYADHIGRTARRCSRRCLRAARGASSRRRPARHIARSARRTG
jgi:ATP-dependent DNA ligase